MLAPGLPVSSENQLSFKGVGINQTEAEIATLLTGLGSGDAAERTNAIHGLRTLLLQNEGEKTGPPLQLSAVTLRLAELASDPDSNNEATWTINRFRELQVPAAIPGLSKALREKIGHPEWVCGALSRIDTPESVGLVVSYLTDRTDIESGAEIANTLQYATTSAVLEPLERLITKRVEEFESVKSPAGYKIVELCNLFAAYGKLGQASATPFLANLYDQRPPESSICFALDSGLGLSGDPASIPRLMNAFIKRGGGDAAVALVRFCDTTRGEHLAELDSAMAACGVSTTDVPALRARIWDEYYNAIIVTGP